MIARYGKPYFLGILTVVGLLVPVLLIDHVPAVHAAVTSEYHAPQTSVAEELQGLRSELESLRTDVVTTHTENTIFLKILVLKPGVDRGLAREIARSVVLRSREHHRDPDLVLAIIDVESDFNPNAVSPTGATGLMQIMPSWKGPLNITRDLREVDTSVHHGLKILSQYQEIFGSIEMALTAYNRGPGAVTADMKAGKNPYNGYSEAIMKTYARIKSWLRP